MSHYQDASDKLNTFVSKCVRISNEHREKHAKLMTVYAAFKRLQKSATVVNNNTTRLLESLPELIDDASMRQMKEESNEIMKDFQQKMDVLNEQLEENSTGEEQMTHYDFDNISRKQVMNDGNSHLRSQTGGSTAAEDSVTNTSNTLYISDTSDSTSDTSDSSETTNTSSVNSNSGTHTEHLFNEYTEHDLSKSVKQFCKDCTNVYHRTSSRQNVLENFSIEPNEIDSESNVRIYPFRKMLLELSSARGWVDYTLQNLHQLFSVEELRDMVAFSADGLTPSFIMKYEDDSATNDNNDSIRDTYINIVENVRENLRVDEEKNAFAWDRIYLQLVLCNGQKIDPAMEVEYYAPIWYTSLQSSHPKGSATGSERYTHLIMQVSSSTLRNPFVEMCGVLSDPPTALLSFRVVYDTSIETVYSENLWDIQIDGNALVIDKDNTTNNILSPIFPQNAAEKVISSREVSADDILLFRQVLFKRSWTGIIKEPVEMGWSKYNDGISSGKMYMFAKWLTEFYDWYNEHVGRSHYQLGVHVRNLLQKEPNSLVDMLQDCCKNTTTATTPRSSTSKEQMSPVHNTTPYLIL